MRVKPFQTILGVVVFYFHILGVHGETDEEAQPAYEYVQIFKSIPALFEYLLDALEERPEILEKNDVTLFNRNLDVDNSEECENSEYDNGIDKRNAKCDVNDNNFNSVNKRDTDTSDEVKETTATYEYGNSNVVTTGLDEIDRSKVLKVTKRLVDNDFNNKDVGDMKNKIKTNENRLKGRFKRDVLSKLDDDSADLFRTYGEGFFGFEHLFGLDLKPEEIEERILEAEKLLEEHNSKKNEE
ncbi:hypothetical protein B5X24_HaOG209538 [Helicoverpa armigera]|uniref:Uncharacterized protein n=1 Tax=Helicoverpa armigera TaxID=29058 RepID=A0A2W1BI77_HELAM|nr:hypothetical protein B5X24_HaOG209538 [Helicoverpa armigera]